MPRVVVLGSSNTDMTVRLPRLPGRGETVLGGKFVSGPGGKGANQAVAARRAGGEVLFLTAVGDDSFGREALDHYRREQIDVTLARVLPNESSGIALILVEEGGENSIGVAPGANAKLTPDDVDGLPDAVFEPKSVLLASLEVPIETVVRGLQRARRAGMLTILNPAPAHPLTTAGGEEALAAIDVLTPNQSELATLAGLPCESDAETLEAARALQRRWGVRAVVVTLGPRGALVVEGEARHVAPRPVDAVDTVGAGDAFNGALAVALAEGRPLLEAAAWANAAAALSVTRRGAQAGLPLRDEIDRLVSQAPST